MLYNNDPRYIIAEDPNSYRTPEIEPVHLWNRTRKDIAPLRKTLILRWIFASVQLWLLIFLMSAIYLGTGTNPNKYTGNLDVAVVNLDGDQAGDYFFQAFQQSPPGNTTLHWRYKYPSDYNGNIDDTQQDLDNGQVWAIVALRRDTTSLIRNSLSALINSTKTLTSPFGSTSPVLVIYETGRNSFTVSNFVLPAIRSAIAVATARYGRVLRQELINNLTTSSNSSIDRNVQLRNVLQLGSILSDPLAATYEDIHPASPFVGQYISLLLFEQLGENDHLQMQCTPLFQGLWRLHWVTSISI